MHIRSTKPSFIAVKARKGASRLRRQRSIPSFNACPSRRTDVSGTVSGRTRSSASLRKMSFPIVSERRGAAPVRHERPRPILRDDSAVCSCVGSATSVRASPSKRGTKFPWVAMSLRGPVPGILRSRNRRLSRRGSFPPLTHETIRHLSGKRRELPSSCRTSRRSACVQALHAHVAGLDGARQGAGLARRRSVAAAVEWSAPSIDLKGDFPCTHVWL
jgi:hypothetical protein